MTKLSLIDPRNPLQSGGGEYAFVVTDKTFYIHFPDDLVLRLKRIGNIIFCIILLG